MEEQSVAERVIAAPSCGFTEAGDAQMLGAALNHSALNVANALGAWLGGVVIAAGLGYAAPGAVGAVLAALGLAVLGWSAALRRRSLRAQAPVRSRVADLVASAR